MVQINNHIVEAYDVEIAPPQPLSVPEPRLTVALVTVDVVLISFIALQQHVFEVQSLY